MTEFCFRRRITAPHESTERDASVWQQVGPLHSRKFCDTSLCKCQPHPIRWLRDAIAHEGMPPIKFYICHWVQFFISLFYFFFPSFSRKLHTEDCCGRQHNAIPWQTKMCELLQSYLMLLHPHTFSQIFLGHVCACYSFASSLDLLHISYIYNNVCGLHLTSLTFPLFLNMYLHYCFVAVIYLDALIA